MAPNSQIINILIAAGTSELAKKGIITREILDLKLYGNINTKGPKFWEDILPALSDEELFSIVRSTVLAEKEHKWSGGSAASVIYIFREVQQRTRMFTEEVADWVLANTNNHYLPFGFNNHEARSLEDYWRISAKLFEAKRIRDLQLSEELSRAKRDREILAERRTRTARLRNTPERAHDLQVLGRLPLAEQLEYIAKDPLYSPNYYSTRSAYNATHEVLASLSKEIRQSLLRKLKGKQKGAWGKVKKRLLVIEPIPWE